MLNYAQKTPLIIYNTSYVKSFKNLSYLQYFLCVDIWSNCVKNLSALSFALTPLPPLFRGKKETICISVDSNRDSDKLQQNQDP